MLGGKNTIFRFMKSEGWRPLRRQKKPLLTTKQRAAQLKFANQYKNLTAEEWDEFLFSEKCSKFLFQLPNPKNDIVWVSQESQVPPAYQVKKSLKWIIWGGMTGRGLPRIHFLTPRTDFDCDYYINNILEKEVKPVLHRKNVNEATDKWKLFSSNCHKTFVQDGAPAQAAKATQAWCQKNLPNFIKKTCWPLNSPDINPVENLWSIMDEVVYKDTTPKPWRIWKDSSNKPGRKSRSPRYMTYTTPCRNGLETW